MIATENRYAVSMTDERAKFIGHRVRLYRTRARLTQQQLADAAYVSRGYITRIENGLNIPAVPVLEQLASALGVTREDLLDPTRRVTPSAEEQAAAFWKETVERVRGFAIPYYGSVPADSMRFTAASEREEFVHVPGQWIQGVRDPFALTVSGNCLEALDIHSGDIVVCTPHHEHPLHDGTLVVVRVGDDVTLKQWFAVDGGIELRDGNGQIVERLSRASEAIVEGIAVGHYRGFTRL